MPKSVCSLANDYRMRRERSKSRHRTDEIEKTVHILLVQHDRREGPEREIANVLML